MSLVATAGSEISEEEVCQGAMAFQEGAMMRGILSGRSHGLRCGAMPNGKWSILSSQRHTPQSTNSSAAVRVRQSTKDLG